MKVSLIFPPSKVGGCFQNDPELWPPLGLLYLAAVLQQEGHTVEVIDSTILSEKEYNIKIDGIHADVVGISASFGQIEAVKRIAHTVKARGIPVVVGGPGPSSMDAAHVECTCVVKGEGEKAIVDIMNRLEAGAPLSVPGATTINGQVVHHGEPTYNVDTLPFPARDLLPITDYVTHWNRHFPHAVTSVISSRGCPFHCIFCSKSIFGKKFRARSAENIVEELRIIQEIGFDRVWFVDDLFVYDKKRVKKFCETIKKEKIDIEWACQTRVELVDRNVLTMMKKAGLICVAFGVESGSQRIIDWFKKGFSLTQLKTAFHLCHDAGIATHAYFIVGTPGETSSDIEKTKKLITVINPSYAVFSVLTPYPGTLLYKKYPVSVDFDAFNDAQKSFIPGQENAHIIRKEMEEFYVAFKEDIGEKPLLLGEI